MAKLGGRVLETATHAGKVVDRTGPFAVWSRLTRGARCLRFFFSSRRRHTRCSRDWSSDVCSSDLVGGVALHRPLEAVPFFQRAVESDPTHVVAALNLAEALIGIEQKGPAIEQARRALDRKSVV